MSGQEKPKGKSGEEDREYFGFESVRAEEKQDLVNGVFQRVADSYDLMNDLMSGGLHRIWKDMTVALLAPPRHKSGSSYRLLDVAGGTGDLAFRVRACSPYARIVLFDINAQMLSKCRERVEQEENSDFDFVRGNAEFLPFPEESFDACTIAFGIRNVTRMELALQEMFRVLRPGGRFLCLEFSQVVLPLLKDLYHLYSFSVIPAMGEWVSGDSDSYRYLVESIQKFPAQDCFADRIRAAGFARVSYQNLSGGIAAIHSGWKL